MAEDWTYKLRKLLRLLTGDDNRPNNLSIEPNVRQTIDINLGIDFGTSFTKVCFRDVGAERSGVIAFDGRSVESALTPSIVNIDAEGKLQIPEKGLSTTGVISVRYLKMYLAGQSIENDPKSILGHNLNDRQVISALSSWYIATVIQCSQQWVHAHERQRVKNRRIIWSANIGVPVEHYDSGAIERFREVFDVAWRWSQNDQIPLNLVSALSAYSDAAGTPANQAVDCHAVPEIAAAVQSFIVSREAVPGIYIYFDVGGGTVDGVAFNFINNNGERRINFYSGKVSPLGIAALLHTLRLDESQNINLDAGPAELQRLLANSKGERLGQFGKNIQLLVADVIMTAKNKDNRDWQIDDVQGPYPERKRIGSLAPSQMRPLIIFVGGGGSRFDWYQHRISATYKEFNHHQAGIPPYKLIEVPRPKDLEMGHIPDLEFRRLSIAYGLSVPLGEGPEVRLPSQFKNAPPLPPSKPKHVIDYANSKDAYDLVLTQQVRLDSQRE